MTAVTEGIPEHLQALVQSLVTRAVSEVIAAMKPAEPQGPPPDPRTMDELWEGYLPRLTNENSAANARAARKKGDGSFNHRGQRYVLAQLTYSQLTKPLLEDWLRYLRSTGLKAATVDQVRKCWQAMLGYYVLREEPGFVKNPFSRMPFEAREGEGERQGAMTAEDVEKLAPYAPAILVDMCRVAQRAGGLRNTELRTWRKDQISWEAAKGWVVRKGGRVTTFIIPADVLPIIRRWYDASPGDYIFGHPRDPRGKPIIRQTFNRWFREAADKAGLVLTGGEKAVPHHLRHGFISAELAKGQPETHVAQQAGHKSTAQLARYGKLRENSEAEEAYRERANMTVAEARRRGPQRSEYPCPECEQTYADIRMAAACFDKHQRKAARR